MTRPIFRSFGVLLAALLLSSCSESGLQTPTSPIDPVSAPAGATSARTGDITDALPNPRKLELKALWWNGDWEPQRVVKVTQTIDPSGGVIKIPQTGLTMLFPAGAVRAPIKITVSSDDSYVAYKMEPSGTQFLKDVTVTQLLSFTEVGGDRLRKQLFAAYIADDNLKLSGKIRVLEIEPSTTVFSPRTGLPEAQVWLIKHFSRYMLASG
ncbi:MAG: hypothetical protein M3Z54_09745 [Gemmatimonadota bacterium]|nr:hypothetical protein [Gemmatimonadota bacterium]